jgi:hypothetical protein
MGEVGYPNGSYLSATILAKLATLMVATSATSATILAKLATLMVATIQLPFERINIPLSKHVQYYQNTYSTIQIASPKVPITMVAGAPMVATIQLPFE